MDEANGQDGYRDEIYSNAVRAGKRTYFFDIKSTRASDFYITITESKRRTVGDSFTYEKHKIFLYKEDFDKFIEALKGTVDHVKTELMPDFDFSQFDAVDTDEFLEFRIQQDAITLDIDLIITEFVNSGDEESAASIWDAAVDSLRFTIGA